MKTRIPSLIKILTLSASVFLGAIFFALNVPISQGSFNPRSTTITFRGTSSVVRALALNGNDLFVGGFFTQAGNIPVNAIARWNAEWFPLVNGVTLSDGLTTGQVFALATRNNLVYVGGNFQHAGALTADSIAKWDGSLWSGVGSGLLPTVKTIVVSGTNGLVAGGTFMQQPLNNIAGWAGGTWSPLGQGADNEVRTLAISSTEIYVGGCFKFASSRPLDRLARWNGEWLSITNDIDESDASCVNAIAISGTEIYIGGNFKIASEGINNIAKLDLVTNRWDNLKGGVDKAVYAIVISRNNVYVGGEFTEAGGQGTHGIARWDGADWSRLGNPNNNGVVKGSNSGIVYAIAITQSKVYVGGDFDHAGGVPADNIALWDSLNWSALVTATPPPPPTSPQIINIAGPTTGLTNTLLFFTTTVAPPTTTRPITFVWQATEQQMTTTTIDALTHVVAYTWRQTGTQLITVTALNEEGAISKVHTITIVTNPVTPISNVNIIGPTTGVVGLTYTFTAVVSPENATPPFDYDWFPTPIAGQGYSTAIYIWSVTGTQLISVTATNSFGSASDEHEITLMPPPPLYLPLIHHCPPPAIPQIETIDNSDGDGSYTVTWNPASLAEGYVLEETKPLTSAPPVLVAITRTFYFTNGKGPTNYNYRVKAQNKCGDSNWSEYTSVIVRWEFEPNNSLSQANGPLDIGKNYYGYPNDTDDYFYIVTTGGTMTIDLTNYTGKEGQLVVYDNSATIITRAFSSPFQVQPTFAAGTYYIRIYTKSGYTNTIPYTLRITQ